MNINQLLKQKREALEPKRVYPCRCEFKCERLGGNLGACDNCPYCGTDRSYLADQAEYFEDNQDVLEYYKETGRIHTP